MDHYPNFVVWSHISYASFQNQPRKEIVLLYKLDGNWEVENLKGISVVRRFRYILYLAGIENL